MAQSRQFTLHIFNMILLNGLQVHLRNNSVSLLKHLILVYARIFHANDLLVCVDKIVFLPRKNFKKTWFILILRLLRMFGKSGEPIPKNIKLVTTIKFYEAYNNNRFRIYQTKSSLEKTYTQSVR